ncbi:MAG: hypothetical protein K2R93_00420 [Gemmatimonadaceae bacterium]|nr:hypothetical protein [Gemmatimonadaceae bacterium]
MPRPTLRLVPRRASRAAWAAGVCGGMGVLLAGGRIGAQVVGLTTTGENDCTGRRIVAIDVHTAPAAEAALPSALRSLADAQSLLQTTTRPEIVRRFLPLDTGVVCTPALLEEAERVLRAQRIFSHVEVRAIDDPHGVRVDVETADESNVALAPYVQSSEMPLRGGKVGALNLGGTARIAEVEWREGGGYQNAMGVRYVDRLFAGRPQQLQLAARRTLDGYDVHAAIARPIYTASQRVAFIASVDRSLGYAPLRRVDESLISVPVSQAVTMFGATRRTAGAFGERILGLAVATATLDATGTAMRPSAFGFVADSGTPVATGFRVQRVARVNLLAGLDRSRFVVVRGFDALRAVQDVRVGSQWSVQLGQSVPVAALRDRDQFVAIDGYAGTGGARSFGAMQFRGEARRDLRTNRWDGQVVSGHSALYLKPAARVTTVLTADASAAWRVQSPFQLSLADVDGGVLGYRRSLVTGARRAVVQAEQRVLLPSWVAPARMPMDIGLAVFAQAGRLWADDFVPYATDTPWQSVVGLGVLVSPPEARRLYRVDVGVPLAAALPGATPQRIVVRLTITDRTRTFWREPRDIAAGREATHPDGLVSWP